MDASKKYHRPPSNIVYEIDGASYGVDDDLIEALKTSIRRKVETKTLDVPRLPQVAHRILQLSRSAESTLDDFVDVISTDPLLATRLVQLAHSASYTRGSKVESLRPAVMLIGFKAVQDLVFAESIRLRIFSSNAYRAILEESWKLSLGTALACEALSAEIGLEGDTAFLMGLLHDTGKPVIVSAIGECERQNKGQSFGADTVEIVLSQLHEEIGAYVLEGWDMSPSIVDAARNHHRYLTKTSNQAQALVHAANLVCQHLGIGDLQKDVDFTVQHVFADLNLADRDRIHPILESVGASVSELMSGLGSAGPPDLN